METIILKKLVKEPETNDHKHKSDSPVVLQIQIPQPGVIKPQVKGKTKKAIKKRSLALLEKVKLNPEYLEEAENMNRFKAYLDTQTAYVRKFMI